MKYGVCHQKCKDKRLPRLWAVLIILLIFGYAAFEEQVLVWLMEARDFRLLTLGLQTAPNPREFQSSADPEKTDRQTQPSLLIRTPILLRAPHCSYKPPLYSPRSVFSCTVCGLEGDFTNPINQPSTMTPTLTPCWCLKIPLMCANLF